MNVNLVDKEIGINYQLLITVEDNNVFPFAGITECLLAILITVMLPVKKKTNELFEKVISMSAKCK